MSDLTQTQILKQWLEQDGTKLFLTGLKKYRLKYLDVLARNNTLGNAEKLQHDLGNLAGVKFIIDLVGGMQAAEEENKNNKTKLPNEDLNDFVELCKNDILTLIE